MRTTISRIDRNGENTIVVVVRFDSKPPQEKHYVFNVDEVINEETISEKIKGDLEKLESIQNKIDNLQSLIGRELT